MKFIKDKPTLFSLAALLMLYGILGLTIYFTYNSEVITSVASFINYYFNIQGKLYILWVFLLFMAIVTNITAIAIVIMAREHYTERIKMIKDNKIEYKGFIGSFNKLTSKYVRGIYNSFAIFGIIILLLSEVFVFAIISLIVASFVINFTNNLYIIVSLMILAILGTYTWISKYIEYVFTGRVSVLRYIPKYGYLNETDEVKIKGWSLIIGALITVFTIFVTIIGILDQNILTEMNNNDDLTMTLFLLSVGVITSALRASKGSLRVL